jgi:hypothetical protein
MPCRFAKTCLSSVSTVSESKECSRSVMLEKSEPGVEGNFIADAGRNDVVRAEASVEIECSERSRLGAGSEGRVQVREWASACSDCTIH